MSKVYLKNITNDESFKFYGENISHYDREDVLPETEYMRDDYIYTVSNEEDEDLGFVWYKKLTRDEGFIADFLICEECRGMGYGKETMMLLMDKARELGQDKIMLNVPKPNTSAIEMYKKMGYEIVKEDGDNMCMALKILSC